MVSSLRVKWWFVAVVGHTIVIVLHDGGQCWADQTKLPKLKDA
jgi:3-mercaptopyruvate sulfurtransferase SseA